MEVRAGRACGVCGQEALSIRWIGGGPGVHVKGENVRKTWRGAAELTSCSENSSSVRLSATSKKLSNASRAEGCEAYCVTSAGYSGHEQVLPGLGGRGMTYQG